VGGTLRTVIALNPLTPIFELARRWIIQPDAPVLSGPLYVIAPAAISVAICVLAVWVFNREAPRIAEAL
jgi:ABC-2 type transport system permease protein